MKVYTCPLCESATDADGEPFVDVDAVVAHVDDGQDEIHDGERGSDYADAIADHGVDVSDPRSETVSPSVSFVGDEPTIRYEDGKRPLGEVLEEMDEYVTGLDVKFKRVVQEQQHAIKRLEETIQAQKFAIQELQAGMEALAGEHDKDAEYQFEL